MPPRHRRGYKEKLAEAKRTRARESEEWKVFAPYLYGMRDVEILRRSHIASWDQHWITCREKKIVKAIDIHRHLSHCAEKTRRPKAHHPNPGVHPTSWQWQCTGVRDYVPSCAKKAKCFSCDVCAEGYWSYPHVSFHIPELQIDQGRLCFTCFSKLEEIRHQKLWMARGYALFEGPNPLDEDPSAKRKCA